MITIENDKGQDICIDVKRQTKPEEIANNMRELLARKQQNIIWGNGYYFESNNPKVIEKYNKINKDNDLLNLFSFCERELSKHGRCIITINKRKNGDIMLGLGLPNWFNGVARTFIQEELAVVYQRFRIDQSNFVVKSTYDRYKCVNEFYGDQGDILVLSEQIKLAESLQIERVWFHNLGFVPVRELVNIPVYYYDFRNTDYITLADWWPAQFYEKIMYDLYLNFMKEINFNHSRVGIDDSSQEVIAAIKKQVQTSSSEVYTVDDFVVNTIAGAKVTVIPGQGDFSSYTNAMKDTMDFYFKFCNTSRFSDGGGAQKTSAEANSTKDNTIETIMSKIRHRERQYSKILNLMLSAYDVTDSDTNEYDFMFKINGNVDHNESAMVDNVVKQINIGTMSVVDAISTLRKIGKNEAKILFDEIKEFNEENDIITTNQVGDMDAGMDVGGNDGGAPTKEK